MGSLRIRRVRRRRDGLVEIRRWTALDLVATPDTALVLALMAGWILFCVALVAALVDPPILLAMPVAFVLLGTCGVLAKPAPLVPEPTERMPPPPRDAA